MFNTSYLKVDEIWREILICDGTETLQENKIIADVSDTIVVTYYTNGLYKSVDSYNWYIVNAKESIVDNPSLVNVVATQQEKIDQLTLLLAMQGGAVIG